MLNKLLLYILAFLFIIIISYIVPKSLIILATPFVYNPQIFNESLIEISVATYPQKVIIRANVSDSENNLNYVWLNLTASNGSLIYNNLLMTNTTISCGTYCWIFEKNYSLIQTDPDSTWIVNVSANDTYGNVKRNSTTFSVKIPPSYSLNSTNSTLAGTSVSHNLLWTDYNLSYAIFSFDNCTGELENITGMSLEGEKAWSNFTVTINSTVGCNIRWKVYANDSFDNWNESEIFTYTTTSECAIALGLSNTLASGIFFGEINPGQKKDALGNNGNAATDYYLTVFISGCSPNTVNVYMKANGDFISDSYSIPLANFKFRNSTTDNTVPSSLQNISLTTSYLDNKIGSLLSDGSYVYLKFVLEVPSSQRAGNYTNTIYFWAGRSDLSPPS
ncbi:MAG: hypothetical protein QXQ69_02585 [Candidatus Aenigmatarchaeota archaeon]